MNENVPSTPDARASDTDRKRVAEVLIAAVAAGRLTLGEHSERLDALYASKTLGDLERLTADLPSSAVVSPTYPSTKGLFSKIRRQGQWVVGGETSVSSVFAAVIIDLSAALFAEREVTIDASAFCGKTVIKIPANASVYDAGTAVFGKRTVTASPPSSPGGPIIRVEGRSLLSKLTIVRAGDKHDWHSGLGPE